MIRVVADSNVYISALNFGGVADAVLALRRRRLIALFVSPSILKEVEGVLLRKFKWSAKRARHARTLISAFTETVVPKERVTAVTTDETDNLIRKSAVAAHAQIVVTGDNHLLTLGRFGDVTILSPREFLDAKVWEVG